MCIGIKLGISVLSRLRDRGIFIALILVFISLALPTKAQISTTMYAGPDNNGVDIIQICMSITNLSNNTITLIQNQEQIIVVQFGDAPINADFTADASCLRSDQFEVISSTIFSLIDENSVSTARSDRQDFEVAFRFSQSLELGSGETVELFCGQNTNINGSCDNLVFLLDCSGTQFTIFNNGSIMPMGIDDCTQGFAQQCDPNRPDALTVSLTTEDPSCSNVRDGNITTSIEGGVGSLTYEWSNGETTDVLANLPPDIYSVTVTDSLECVSSESTSINPTPQILLNLSSEYTCLGESTGSATAEIRENGTPPFSYQWNDPMGQNTSTATNLSVGTYIVTITDDNGCIREGAVSVETIPTDDIEVGCVMVTNESITFSWSLDSTASSYEVKVNDEDWIAANQNTSHIVSGLNQDQSVTIEVRGIRECTPYPQGMTSCIAFVATLENSVYIPNVFSPNNDGINDLFEIGTRPEAQIQEVTIYERFGGVVFNASALNGEDIRWDGTKNGKPINPQVLAYRVLALYNDGRSEVATGDVTLVK